MYEQSRKMMQKFALSTVFLLISSCLVLVSCEDETRDFTSGSFYPVDPTQTNPDTTKDTTVVVPPPANCWKDPISVSLATDFNQLFTRYTGWTGGDATYSIPLPDGRNLWLFGDSFIGTVRPDRSRPGSAFFRNAAMIQQGNDFTTLPTNGNAFIRPPDPGWWYWPGHGTADGDTLRVVMFGMKTTGSGAWDFAYASLDVATFHLPELSLVSIERKKTDPATNYGAGVMTSGDYTYIYGSEKVGFAKYLHVARVHGRDLSGQWEYFDGTGWTTDEASSARVFASVSDQLAVFEDNGKFYLLTQHHILGGEIYLYDADSPVGAFKNKRTVYCTPQSHQGNLFTYNAFAHPQFSGNGELLVSYNVNSSSFSDLFQNADTYRPFFVRIKGWN
ncbi:MAG: hypothetical protein RJA20_580 [Bacteroidota bacterium]|jgi:hypothetical protein